MWALCATALLCLLTVSQSAPPPCEELVRPLDLDNFQHFLGRWVLVAGSLSNPENEEKFRQRETASITIVNGTTGLSLHRNFGFGNTCHYSSSNITMDGGSFNFNDYNVTVSFLHSSCADCAVMRFDNNARDVQRLYLFSRGREVKQEEADEFSAQAKCFNMLSPIMLDPTKELCPEKITD